MKKPKFNMKAVKALEARGPVYNGFPPDLIKSLEEIQKASESDERGGGFMKVKIIKIDDILDREEQDAPMEADIGKILTVLSITKYTFTGPPLSAFDTSVRLDLIKEEAVFDEIRAIDSTGKEYILESQEVEFIL
jgi:hypothetical protein